MWRIRDASTSGRQTGPVNLWRMRNGHSQFDFLYSSDIAIYGRTAAARSGRRRQMDLSEKSVWYDQA